MSLTDGILFQYALNGDYLDTFETAPDLSPTSAPTFSAGKLGDGLDVGGHGAAGANARADATDDVFSVDGVDRTFAGWFYADDYTGDPGVVDVWANGGGGAVQWLFWHDGGALKLQIRDTSNADHVATSTVTPPTAVWTFFCLTYDSTTGDLTIQIDDETPVIASTPDVKAGVSSFSLGDRNNGGATFHGMIDNFAGWNRVLSTPEIEEYRNGGDGLELAFSTGLDTRGIRVQFIRRDFRSTDEVDATQRDASLIFTDPFTGFPTANSTEYRVRLTNDPLGTPVVVETTPWNVANDVSIDRTTVLRATAGVLPTFMRVEVEARHTVEAEILTAAQTLSWDFDTTFSELADDTNLGLLEDGDISNIYTTPETGDYTIEVGTALATGAIQYRLNVGSWTTVIVSGHLRGIITGVTASDTIEVRHSQPDSGNQTFLQITPPTSTVGAYAILVI